MALRLEVRNVTEVRAKLAALVDNLADMEGLWERYGKIMAVTEGEWFASAGDGAWPPLADSTVREKVAGGWPIEPMIRRGDLLESLMDPARAMEIGQGRSTLGTFTRNAMTWGTDVEDDRGREFAHYHQHTDPVTGEPTVAYGNDPPLRQVIPWPLPLQTRAEMDAADEEWVADVIRRSGLD